MDKEKKIPIPIEEMLKTKKGICTSINQLNYHIESIEAWLEAKKKTLNLYCLNRLPPHCQYPPTIATLQFKHSRQKFYDCCVLAYQENRDYVIGGTYIASENTGPSHLYSIDRDRKRKDIG